MRVVLDTNVLFAAFAARGLCEALVSACLHAHEVVLSDYILEELCGHLRGKLKMAARDVRDIEALLREDAEIVVPLLLADTACPDPDDLPVLGTAIAGRTDALVTGDAALLKLGTVHGVPIISPRQLYDRLR